jgi:hypothetical protein
MVSDSARLIHLHGFKCAGTTFGSILEKNFPKQVLYVESIVSNQRLNFEQVKPILEIKPYKALSSHLLAKPQQSESLVITFLRDPIDRLISAYEFQKTTNTLKTGDDNFRAFLNRLRNSAVSNYQTRLISEQSWEGSQQRMGWDLNPWSINLDDPNLFIGSVELFDESLVLLERWLSDKGIEFDASYKVSSNRTVKSNAERLLTMRELVYKDMVELDEFLFNKVKDRIEKQISSHGEYFDKLLFDFRTRGSVIAEDPVLVSPESFLRL